MFAQNCHASRITGRSGSGPTQHRVLVLLAILCLFHAQALCADREHGAFHTINATTRVVEGIYRLNAWVDISLSPGVREALDNGIPLVFELQVQVLKVRNWRWDSVVAGLKQARQLQYHALSRSYLVKNINTGEQQAYHRLGDALVAAGSIQNLPILDKRWLESGLVYTVRLRGDLDIESLPTPVRLMAYLSSSWDMDSDWYTWTLSQ